MRYHPIERRTVLRGIGCGLSLPLLNAMQPVSLAAESASAPVRSAFIFFPNGVIMDPWRPRGTGREFEFGPTMESLAEHRDDLLIISGLAQHHARANGDGPGDHARNASAYLTGAQPHKTSGADISVGVSIDQAIAKSIGRATRLPSLELGIDAGRNAGNCDSGYSCAYSANISWVSETTPMAKEVHPRLAFDRLFGIGRASADQKRRDAERRSILDFVASDAKRLQKQVGRADRERLDEYFTSVRDVEQQIEHAQSFAPPEVPDAEVPDEIPGEFAAHLQLMYEIQALAFQTDSTRISTLMLGNAGSNRTYPEVEVRDGHHSLSHHQNDEQKVDHLTRIDRYLVDQFAAFLKRLKSIPEGNGSLLDNCAIVYGSAISDGNRHQHHDLPIVVAGGAGGTIATGRHLEVEAETPLNNLFLAMSDRMGAGLTEHGDSTGSLDLTAPV